MPSVKIGSLVGIVVVVVLVIIFGIYFYLPEKQAAEKSQMVEVENLDSAICTGRGVGAGPLRSCCDGLDKVEIPLATSVADECHILPISLSISRPQQLICLDCGNNICETGESVCTCPEDCVGKGNSDYKTVSEFCDSKLGREQIFECNKYPGTTMSLCGLCG